MRDRVADTVTPAPLLKASEENSGEIEKEKFGARELEKALGTA